jgi:hypothetical protein
MTAPELPPYIYGREAGPNEKIWTEGAITGLLQEVRSRSQKERFALMQEWREANAALCQRERDAGIRYGMEQAAVIAENTLESVSDRSSIYGTESAAAIREAAKGTSLQLIVSSAVPEDEVHLRDSAGKLIGKIVGVKP